MTAPMQLPFDVLERFDAIGASKEVFELWQELEARAARTAEGNVPVPPTVRQCAIRYIDRMAQQSGFSWSSFYLCVALFDTFCGQRDGRSGVEATPFLCAAVVGIVKKEDSALAIVNYSDLAEQATRVFQLLSSSVTSWRSRRIRSPQ